MSETVPLAAVSHVVVVNLRLSDRRRGTPSERMRIALLEAELEEAFREREDMTFGGRDIGEGYCSLYCFGRNAEAVYAVVQARLRGHPVGGGSYAELSFGSLTDPAAARRRVELP